MGSLRDDPVYPVYPVCSPASGVCRLPTITYGLVGAISLSGRQSVSWLAYAPGRAMKPLGYRIGSSGVFPAEGLRTVGQSADQPVRPSADQPVRPSVRRG